MSVGTAPMSKASYYQVLLEAAERHDTKEMWRQPPHLLFCWTTLNYLRHRIPAYPVSRSRRSRGINSPGSPRWEVGLSGLFCSPVGVQGALAVADRQDTRGLSTIQETLAAESFHEPGSSHSKTIWRLPGLKNLLRAVPIPPKALEQVWIYYIADYCR